MPKDHERAAATAPWTSAPASSASSWPAGSPPGRRLQVVQNDLDVGSDSRPGVSYDRRGSTRTTSAGSRVGSRRPTRTSAVESSSSRGHDERLLVPPRAHRRRRAERHVSAPWRTRGRWAGRLGRAASTGCRTSFSCCPAGSTTTRLRRRDLALQRSRGPRSMKPGSVATTSRWSSRPTIPTPLSDHAHRERRLPPAARPRGQEPDFLRLVDYSAVVREMEHFQLVVAELRRRGGEPGPQVLNHYADACTPPAVSTTSILLDRLLAAHLIEGQPRCPAPGRAPRRPRARALYAGLAARGAPPRCSFPRAGSASGTRRRAPRSPATAEAGSSRTCRPLDDARRLRSGLSPGAGVSAAARRSVRLGARRPRPPCPRPPRLLGAPRGGITGLGPRPGCSPPIFLSPSLLLVLLLAQGRGAWRGTGCCCSTSLF